MALANLRYLYATRQKMRLAIDIRRLTHRIVSKEMN